MNALKDFLRCTDLDELLKARAKLHKISSKDSAQILEILQSWDQPQAVANILFYPDLIERTERFHYLQEALHDDIRPYYSLAAAVGISMLEAESFSKEQQGEILKSLFRIMDKHTGIIAERTAITILHLARREHSSILFGLLEHANENVRHNVLASLIQQSASEQAASLKLEIANSGISSRTKKECNAAIDEHLEKQKAKQFGNTGMVLFSYIPNLNEMNA